MKRGTNINILILFLISIVFFNFVSAANTCSSGNQIILKLSADTNAHGEVWNGAGGYTTEVCYDQIFGVAGDGNRVCDGNNRVLRLSSSTNAHAEGPLGTNYNTEICYSNLNCDLRSAPSCTGNDANGNPLGIIVKLSSSTNAHLENTNGINYNNAICCSMTGAVLPPPPSQCSDGVDNDVDTFIDFPSDPGCVDLNDNEGLIITPSKARSILNFPEVLETILSVWRTSTFSKTQSGLYRSIPVDGVTNCERVLVSISTAS